MKPSPLHCARGAEEDPETTGGGRFDDETPIGYVYRDAIA